MTARVWLVVRPSFNLPDLITGAHLTTGQNIAAGTDDGRRWGAVAKYLECAHVLCRGDHERGLAFAFFVVAPEDEWHTLAGFVQCSSTDTTQEVMRCGLASGTLPQWRQVVATAPQWSEILLAEFARYGLGDLFRAAEFHDRTPRQVAPV